MKKFFLIFLSFCNFTISAPQKTEIKSKPQSTFHLKAIIAVESVALVLCIAKIIHLNLKYFGPQSITRSQATAIQRLKGDMAALNLYIGQQNQQHGQQQDNQTEKINHLDTITHSQNRQLEHLSEDVIGYIGHCNKLDERIKILEAQLEQEKKETARLRAVANAFIDNVEAGQQSHGSSDDD